MEHVKGVNMETVPVAEPVEDTPEEETPEEEA